MKKYIAHEQSGIFCRTIPVTVSRRLGGMPYAQAGWIDRKTLSGKTAAVLYSYSSKIATVWIDDNGTAYRVDTSGGDAALNCSRTTLRHFTLAMRECGLSDSVIQALKPVLAGGDMVKLVCGKWILYSTGEVIA